jgi:DNA polymerase
VRAPEGKAIVAGDLSQIEARVLAALAPCQALLDLFTSGQDPYKLFAARVYRIDIEDVTDHQRRIFKSAILGLGFGMGPDKFADYLRVMGVTGLSMREVKRLVYDVYRSSFREIGALWGVADSIWMRILGGHMAPRRHGPVCIGPEFIGLPNGMSLHYTNLAFTSGEAEYGPAKNRKHLYGALIVENVVQALARIIVMNAMLRIDRKSASRLRAAFTVHDELLYVVPKHVAEQMAYVLHKALTQKVPWMPGLPIEAEVKIGLSYGEMTQWKS